MGDLGAHGERQNSEVAQLEVEEDIALGQLLHVNRHLVAARFKGEDDPFSLGDVAGEGGEQGSDLAIDPELHRPAGVEVEGVRSRLLHLDPGAGIDGETVGGVDEGREVQTVVLIREVQGGKRSFRSGIFAQVIGGEEGGAHRIDDLHIRFVEVDLRLEGLVSGGDRGELHLACRPEIDAGARGQRVP